jgi:C1A family cysteine protease
MNYGFVASKMDGTEKEFNEIEGMEIPKSYSYKKYLPSVINQGNRPICVPCSVSAYINWNKNLENGDNTHDNKVDLNQIYKSRTNNDDNGMSFKDALGYLRHNCAKINGGCKDVVKRYAKIGSIKQLKQALVMNGPCVGGLPVYDSYRTDFWVKFSNDVFQGGHAIAIVGYNEEGFIIRNSWGYGYGDDGYSVIPYEEFENFMELWTIF